MRKIFIAMTIFIMSTILIACSPPFDPDLYEIVFDEEKPYLTAHISSVNSADTSNNEFVVKVLNKETGKYQLGRILRDSKYMTTYDLPEGVEDFEFIGFDDSGNQAISIQTNIGVYFVTFLRSETNFYHFADLEFQYDIYEHYIQYHFGWHDGLELPYFYYDGKAIRTPRFNEVVEGEKTQDFEIETTDDSIILNIEIRDFNENPVINKQLTLLEENTFLKVFYLDEFLPTIVMIRENEILTINLNYDYEIESTNSVDFTKKINRYGRFMNDMFYVLTDDMLYIYDKYLNLIDDVEISDKIYGINSFVRNDYREQNKIIYVLKEVNNLLIVEEIYKYESVLE